MRATKVKAKIGLYTVGLKHYWGQFEGMRERMIEYGRFIERKISSFENVEVYNYGLVDCSDEGIRAGKYFNEKNVDLIFLHLGTYVTSDAVLPIHQHCKVPVIVLNLQPAAQINYDRTGTGEWLAHCVACPAPEIANAFNRAQIPFRIVNGLLGLDYTPAISVTNENTASRPEAVNAWNQIEQWCRAAVVKAELSQCRFGFLGNNYSGMLDMYSDFTMIQAQTGIHVEILEMCDLNKHMNNVTESEVRNKISEIEDMFEISENSSADPLARRPSPEQLEWSARVAVAQQRLVDEFSLDALAYYYHGSPDSEYEKLQSGFIVGHSLLTARGIPCSGEGDLKTAIAMKICDILGVGGSFCEIVVTDYINGTILLGHDGPFHLAISEGKPVLRGLGLYHGKQGNGVSVEAKVRIGDITTLNLTQGFDGKLKFITSEAKSVDNQIMTIGNTQTHVKFNTDPDTYMTKWFGEYPTHHFAMSVGHNASQFDKVSELLGISNVILN